MMHSSAKISNIVASVLNHIATLDIPGNPVLVYQDQPRFRSDSSAPFVRVSVEFPTVSNSGRWDDSNIASMMAVQVIADFFFPMGDDRSLVDTYAPLRAASTLVDELRALRLQVNDYATPEAPTAISGAVLTFTTPAQILNITEPGWSRRRVVADATVFVRKAA